MRQAFLWVFLSPWQPRRETIPASSGLLSAAGSPDDALGSLAAPCAHAAFQHWQPAAVEGDNEDLRVAASGEGLCACTRQHFIAGLGKAAYPELPCRAGELNSLVPRGGFSL